jgi:hypothetical protein
MRAAAILTTVLAAAVAAPLAAPATEAGAAKPRLKAFESCTGLVGYARRNALRNARDLVAPRLPPGTGGPEPVAAPVPQQEAAGEDFSRTNVQEAGVDEPDVVKTDGRHLFAIARGALHAVDVRAAGLARVGRLALPEAAYGHELLLHGGRALVISRLGAGGFAFPAQVPPPPTPKPPPLPPPPPPPATLLTEIDVSDPARLRVLRTLKVDGDYVSARLTGATARLVVTSEPRALASVRRIRRAKLRGWMPRAVLTRRASARKRTRTLLRCRAVRRPRVFSGLDMVSVLTVDMERGLPAVDADAVLADAETVYASPDSLYVASRRWIDPERVAEGEPPASLRTAIHRFDASRPGTTTYRSSGEARGFLLSQWSLSEHAGHLRVASTEAPDWWEGPVRESESHMTVLREAGGRLQEVGRVGGLGRGERIYSVRFAGDTGYVVTFRETDPLYTLDLADPAAPRVVGELKIFGYSAYLHPVGDDLLLGVGQDATEQGRRLGTQLSLFDVSDLSAPRLLHQRRLAPGSSSEAEYDHRAFLFWPPTGLAVLGVDHWEGFSGAIGFHVGRGGIAEAGRVAHPGPRSGRGIARSLVVGDRLLTVSDGGVMASPLATLGSGAWLAFR